MTIGKAQAHDCSRPGLGSPDHRPLPGPGRRGGDPGPPGARRVLLAGPDRVPARSNCRRWDGCSASTRWRWRTWRSSASGRSSTTTRTTCSSCSTAPGTRAARAACCTRCTCSSPGATWSRSTTPTWRCSTASRQQLSGRKLHSEQFLIYRVLDALTDTLLPAAVGDRR